MDQSEINNLDIPFLDWAKTLAGENSAFNRVMSSDKNAVYELDNGNSKLFLKIGINLELEKSKLEWLKGKLPVPQVMGFTTITNKEGLLMTAIEGENLASLATKWGPEKTIEKLVSALQKFHSTEVTDYSFGEKASNAVLVHGDACLPNFIYHKEELNGYIDLGDMQVGNVEIDLSAAVWTLQYNFGAGYGLRFLQLYGITNSTEDMVEKLRQQYEDKI